MESVWRVAPAASRVDSMYASREKAFRTFSLVTRETTPFTLQRCNTYRVVFLKRFRVFFAFNWDAARKKNVFPAWKASLELSGSCGVRGKRTVASSLPSTSHRSLPFTSGRRTSLRGKVGAFSCLAEMQHGRRTSWLCGQLH